MSANPVELNENKRIIRQRFDAWCSAHGKPVNAETLQHWDERINTGMKALNYDPDYWKQHSLAVQAQVFLYSTGLAIAEIRSQPVLVDKSPAVNGERKAVPEMTDEEFEQFRSKRHALIDMESERLGYYVALRSKKATKELKVAVGILKAGFEAGYKRGKETT